MVFTLKNIFYQHIDWSPKYIYDPNNKVQIRWYLMCQREFSWTESILHWLTLPITLWNFLSFDVFEQRPNHLDPTFIVLTGKLYKKPYEEYDYLLNIPGEKQSESKSSK